VGAVYYVKFRDPITRQLLSKKSTGQRNKTAARQWAKEEWERLESEYKYEIDRQSFIVGARREGKAEGLTEELLRGKTDGLAEAARKMKQNGLSSEEIHKYTQLSLKEIERL
jgi:predicted transposase/invertase (TIGR01784 family)